MTELHPLIEAVHAVQRRTAINGFLARWNRALVWSLAGLLLVAALLPPSAVAVLATVLMILAFGVSALTSWVLRPSVYESARQLDQAAELHDRISTAVHCASIDNPNEMILHQRRDALERVVLTDPSVLFPLQLRALARRVPALAIAVVAILAYRANHETPLMVALEEAVHAPFSGALLPYQSQDVADDNREALARFDPIDVQSPKEQAEGPEGVFPTGELSKSATGGPEGRPNAGADQQTGGGPQDEDASQASERQPRGGSLTDRIRQALKDLFAKASGRTSEDQDQPPSAETGSENSTSRQSTSQQGARSPQSSQSKVQGEAKEGEGSGSSSTEQPGDGNRPSGKSGGAQTGQNSSLQTHPQQDVVALSFTNFKGQARVLTTIEKGMALVPFRDVAALPTATTNGAEQDDVPLRYRLYLQRYFQRPEESPR